MAPTRCRWRRWWTPFESRTHANWSGDRFDSTVGISSSSEPRGSITLTGVSPASSMRPQWLAEQWSGLLWRLCAVPCCDDPHGRALDSIEEPVGPDDDLAIGQVRKLRDEAAGLRKPLQPAQGVAGSLPERRCGLGILTPDICDCREKLGARGRCEANPQEGSSPTRSLASASTSSRSCPTLAAISCSPRTRSRSSSRSCSPCS